jgi:hypothetical protein
MDSLPNIRRMGWTGNAVLMREILEMCSKIVVGKPRLRWEDNLKINLKEIAWEDVNWVHLVQVRTDTIMNLWVL